MAPSPALERFSELTRSWFESSFTAPTPAQEAAWEAISSGRDALVIAPTGSGKTLAGFLWAIDRLASDPVPPSKKLRVLYVSPLKALAADIERNLRTPLHGIRAAASRAGTTVPAIDVAMRTGDTPADERRRMSKSPPDILITTPESLFLLLTSQARDILGSVETVIIDEIHAVAATKRGSHLALSLERLERLTERPPQRLGLSATVRPPEEVARFLGGTREVDVIDPGSSKRWDITIEVPVEDMAELGRETTELPVEASGPEERTSIWPHVHTRLLQLIRKHSSTIVFVNSRRLAERLCAAINDLAMEEDESLGETPRAVARAHHGSISREQRVVIEEALKSGRLPAVVATSSLELGIDMGAVDLVVQVEAPPSVAAGLQRIGRAGHHVGATSSGVIFPKFRGDLLPSAVTAQRMVEGAIESIHYPRNTLDVLAQQIVAMAAMDEWDVDDLFDVVRKAASFADLPRSALESVLDMLAGRYPSNEFAELRARINWDRASNKITGRRGAQRLAVTSGGTIPDRGLFGVFLAGEGGSRVGELDEEMVYESRVGEVFMLGSSSWLIEDITHDRVIVSPAPGQPGKMPFWHGDAPGRPLELGRALGRFVRTIATTTGQPGALLDGISLEERAAANLESYLQEQRDATDVVPDDRTIVVERYRDELGDLRLCIHSFFGAQVHAPWALAIEARLRGEVGVEVQCIYTDDGIIVKLPDTGEERTDVDITFDPDDVEESVIDVVQGSALFASRFRECASRSLLLPRRRPGSRTPLWQQRQKSAFLLQVASRYESFPIVLEAMRECLQDVFDVPGLIELMRDIATRRVRVVQVDTQFPSPFAAALQFGFISAFMYEGDAPLAERRAQALSLDRTLLAEILGREELRELIDEESLVSLELELQLLDDEHKIADADGLHDALRLLGDLSSDEIAARSRGDHLVWLDHLVTSRRAIHVRIAGEERVIAIEDAARYRDALGVALPPGVPPSLLDPVADPIGDVIGRWAARHGPFVAGDVASRLGLGSAVVLSVLERLAATARVVRGEFRPAGSGEEWIDSGVLRRLKRRSLASYRKEVEPVEPDALARFYLGWQGAGPHAAAFSGTETLYGVVEQLTGAPIPASVLERQVLPARMARYEPVRLDELGAAGEVVWCGAGAIGSKDGWVCLAPADDVHLLPNPSPEPLGDVAERVRDVLADRGAMFWRELYDATGGGHESDLLLGLWEAVWAGWVTNDTLAPVRALVGRRSTSRAGRPRRRRWPVLPTRGGPPAAMGRWSIVAGRAEEGTRRTYSLTERMLERHGIVTRGAVAAERVSGGFAAVYQVLKAMEDTGRCRRGYFVDGLGGAQFALPGAVDRLRRQPGEPVTTVLAATDPANPYGAALPWPDPGPGHRAGRKAGGLVVIGDGALVAYVERGGRTILSYDEERIGAAADALGLAVRDGFADSLDVERVNGRPVGETPWGPELQRCGFSLSARGLRLRA